MKLTTLEGTIEHGHVTLPADVHLPEKTKVYVVVPSLDSPVARVASPRLAHPERAIDFRKEVIEDATDAGL